MKFPLFCVYGWGAGRKVSTSSVSCADSFPSRGSHFSSPDLPPSIRLPLEGKVRLSKNHTARIVNAFVSLPLEGKVPSAHTGRMRWKSCVYVGTFCFFTVLLATSSVSCADSFPSRGSHFSSPDLPPSIRLPLEGKVRLSKNHTARIVNAFVSLPLEGKVPSAHTGRMRWKSCVYVGTFCFFTVLLATSSVSCADSFPSRGSHFSSPDLPPSIRLPLEGKVLSKAKRMRWEGGS